LARLHWSGTGLFRAIPGSDWFETRMTAAHPERDMYWASIDWFSLVLHWWLIDWGSRVVSITFAWLLCARRESPLDGQMRFSRSSPHWDGSSWRCMHVWCDRTRMDCQSTSHIVTIVSIVYISRLHSEKCRAYASVTAAFDGTACIESLFLLI
jgi:hypothetical protein